MRVAAALLTATLLCACTAASPPPAGQADLHPELRILRGMEFLPNG